MHTMNTRGKAAREAEKLHTALNGINCSCSEICAKWDTSTAKKDLIVAMEEKVLTQGSMFLDSALCLGLGTLEGDCMNPGDEIYIEMERRNRICQLLVFETVLGCLRKKFKINDVRFQDPDFSAADTKFLEQRGYLVIPYPNRYTPRGWSPREGLDYDLLPLISSSSMIFTPYLPLDATFEVVCAAKPSLFFGTSLISILSSPYLVDPTSRYPMKDFEDFVISREDEFEVEALKEGSGPRYTPIVFLWPADTSDKEAVIRMQARHLAVNEASKKRIEAMVMGTIDEISEDIVGESPSVEYIYS